MERPHDDGSATRLTDLVGILGLAGIALGTVLLGSGDLGFDRVAAITALFAWLPVTLPGVALVLVWSVVELAAGVVLARAIRGRPFDGLDEAILGGFVLLVVKDVLALGLLAGFGQFSQPVLIGIDVGILVLGAFGFRPILGPGAIPAIDARTPFGALLVAAWAAPVLLMIAAPVVPFLDVLPNHVAPAEHLRTFGSLSSLTDTQSPIYGPSRIFLGYTALLGTITTGTGLPAGQALSAFILPSTLLTGIAIWRLATALGGRGMAPWALLTFATTTSMARLGDARATVVVLPLVAWTLVVLAERMAAEPLPPVRRAGRRLLPDGVVLGLGLGAAMLLHPVIGFLAALTVLGCVLAVPARASDIGVPGLVTGALFALPQAATMIGLSLPAGALVVFVVVGVAAGLAVEAFPAIRATAVLAGRALAVVLTLIAVLAAGPIIRAAVAGAAPLLGAMELAIVAAVVAAVLRAPASRSLVLWAALAAGFGVATLTQLVPEEGSGLLGEALRFELPKTLHYWVPVFAALLAAGGLEALLRADRLPVVVRGAGLAAFVGTAALPLRATPIDAFYLGEHRLSETLSIAMRWVQTGFWKGFPDSRYVVDGPRQEILDAVRAEIEAGRIGPDTPILHVAASFQQWRAVPLGVFDGVTETDVTNDAVVSIHTVGGRLRPMAELGALLSGGAYPYVLLEPSPGELPPDLRDRILAAGYTPIFANGQGELFARGG